MTNKNAKVTIPTKSFADDFYLDIVIKNNIKSQIFNTYLENSIFNSLAKIVKSNILINLPIFLEERNKNNNSVNQNPQNFFIPHC